MEKYITFLRGINVGGHKKVPMDELRQMLVKLKLTDVQTYIQSGNILFKSDLKSIKNIEESIHKGIRDTFGFDVPVLVKSVSEVKDILSLNSFDNKIDLENNRIYFVLLFEAPNPSRVADFNKEHYPSEQFAVTNTCVYLCCKNGYGKAKLTNNLIEKKLKVVATARNYRTMQKLLELAAN